MYSPTSRLLTVLELLQSYPVTSVWGGAAVVLTHAWDIRGNRRGNPLASFSE